MRDVVVGVDRSETARRAALAASELAAAYGVNLHIVMCVEQTKAAGVAVGSDRFWSDWLSDAEQYLDELVQTLPNQSVSRSIGPGSPAATLCSEARRLDAKTIVVGNRRVQGLSRVLGSVAADVTRHAHCDVLVANTTGAGHDEAAPDEAATGSGPSA
jgi:nucleotide-binding universal stress UspA family protein